MAEEEPKYCPICRAPWVRRNDFCVQCGHTLMDEGDLHSGPDGYSPNTAYPDTFYGSGMDDDEEEWGR